jgi:tetratricopeptide (TPR) repeat protein
MRVIRALVAAAGLGVLAGQTLDNALEALAKNDTRAAEGALEALTRARPKDPEAALARGVYLFQLGKFQAAREALAPLASDPRAETFVWLSRAATGECPAALPALRSRFDAAGDARIRRLAGLGALQCAVAAGEVETASALLGRLQAAHPGDADVLYLAARFHLKGWNDAIYALFQKAPSSYRVNQISAEIFEIQGNYAAAVGEYRKALEKNPRAINLHYRLGRALLLASHEPAALEQARQEFERELEINPNDAVAEYQVGQILVAQQKADAARPRLERAFQLKPDFPEAALALGRLYVQSGDAAQAIPLLEKAVALTPASEPARYQLMIAYRNAGRPEDARKQQVELEKLQQLPAGEFTEFLKKLGEKPPQEPR